MQQTFHLQDNARAMHDYVQSMVAKQRTELPPRGWSDDLIASIQSQREEIRVFEKGGGMCHEVAYWLQALHGWEPLSVAYLDEQGRVICAGHYLSALPDGSLLDATADQFGEGNDVRLLLPTDSDYGRYRPDFDEDINPLNPDCPGFAPFYWDGTSDCMAQDAMEAQLGVAWWLTQPAQRARHLDYLRHQVELGADRYSHCVHALESELKPADRDRG
jgi:hypothetical protein